MFLSQKQRKKDKCRSSKNDQRNLSTIMPEFQKNDGLTFCLDKLKENYDTFENSLIKNQAKHHKKYYSDYSEEKLKRKKERQNKSNVVSDTSEQLYSPSQSTRSRDISNHDFGILVCCSCFETNTESYSNR